MKAELIHPGDRVIDPLDGSIRTVREVRFETVLMEDGGGMGASEINRVYSPGESIYQHTPGSWEVETIFGRTWISVRDHRSVRSRIAMLTLDKKKDNKANARLIAASPQLLQAARNALGYMRRSGENSVWADELESAVIAAEGGRDEWAIHSA